MLHEIAEEEFAAPFGRPGGVAPHKGAADDALADERRIGVERLLEGGIGRETFGARPAVIGARHQIVDFLEGAAAHIWQLLMAGQIPVILFYAVKWLPRTPRTVLQVLEVQVGAALAALAPVYWLRW